MLLLEKQKEIKPTQGQMGRVHASVRVFYDYEFDPTPYSK
jgi:hypothetical protein